MKKFTRKNPGEMQRTSIYFSEYEKQEIAKAAKLIDIDKFSPGFLVLARRGARFVLADKGIKSEL